MDDILLVREEEAKERVKIEEKGEGTGEDESKEGR